MMKRALLTFFAAAAISLPAMVAPALVMPAAAQSIFAPHAGYGWAPGYRHWEGNHRGWAPGRWWNERHYAHFGWQGYRWHR
jgi:hypothetical protein